MKQMKYVLVALSASSLLLTGCADNRPMPNYGEKTRQGAIIGAAAGAVLGTLISKGSKAGGALVGAAAGAAVGGAIGHRLDRQAEEVAHTMNTAVSRDEKAAAETQDIIVTKTDRYVKITFKNSAMFATNAAEPTPSAVVRLTKLVDVLNRYPDTIIQAVGHTDSRGTYDYNLELSRQRAFSVANLLKELGVKNPIYAKGCAFNQPLVPNDTPEHMAMNRRVEIYLFPSEAAITDVCR